VSIETAPGGDKHAQYTDAQIFVSINNIAFEYRNQYLGAYQKNPKQITMEQRDLMEFADICWKLIAAIAGVTLACVIFEWVSMISTKLDYVEVCDLFRHAYDFPRRRSLLDDALHADETLVEKSERRWLKWRVLFYTLLALGLIGGYAVSRINPYACLHILIHEISHISSTH